MESAKRQALMEAIFKAESPYQLGNRQASIDLAALLDGCSVAELQEIYAFQLNSVEVRRGLPLQLIRAAIDIQIMREHVAAQEKMSAAADKLQRAGLWLAIAAAFMTLVGLYIALVALKH